MKLAKARTGANIQLIFRSLKASKVSWVIMTEIITLSLALLDKLILHCTTSLLCVAHGYSQPIPC